MTSGLTLIRDTNDNAAVGTLWRIINKAKATPNVSVDVVTQADSDSPQTVTLTCPFYYGIGQVFANFYLCDNEVLNAATGIRRGKYHDLREKIVTKVRSGVEDGRLTDQDDIEQFVTEESKLTSSDMVHVVNEFTSSDDAYRMLSDEPENITLTERAQYSLYQDVLDELGDLDDLIAEYAEPTDEQKQQAIDELVSQFVSLLEDDDVIYEAVDEVYGSENGDLRDKLFDYLKEERRDCLRRAMRELS